ncbi:MAG TPA: F0F1 ATP synthase subunit B [Acidimicrobiia bacterium]|nr:F0F1 ATP synthase subunit B [Acidimicrobiia bacterium]
MSTRLWMDILAQEEAEASSNVSLVLPETNELIAGIVAFLIVFFFVWKWAIPAINRTLEARQKAITGKLEDAERAKNEAENLRKDYEQQIADARSKGNDLIEEARKAAEAMKADMIARAQAEAEGIVSKAREEAAQEKSRAMGEARREVANLSIDLAERVVGKNLDREAQLGLVDQYIAELERG